jgi:hypothetical protein
MAEDESDFSEEITSESEILSFIVRIWKEEPASEKGQEVWRGHITPIPSGIRHYFTSFQEIPDFLSDYLKSIPKA